ncbi:MAG: DHH family phosphoesterase [Lachnospiraceae bacterium]|nr:DHH family phosphoesterase [Lachnospiraceae bacterium]
METIDVQLKKYIFNNLGIKSHREILLWKEKRDTRSYWINNISEAAKLIISFKNKRVTICGDYDTDGTSAITIIYRTLITLGFTKVNCKIPRRFSDGFGLKTSMIEDIPDGLIITVDNGIAALEAIALAKEKGLTTIVTDHHEAIVENGERLLPDADIIIDPKAIPNSAEYNGYCGAGLAYRLAEELLYTYGNTEQQKILKPLMSICAIGTVGDVMELHEENYWFVKYGLDYLNKGITFVGIKQLLEQFGITEIDEDTLGYYLSPALNSSGRLLDDGAKYSASLMMLDNGIKTMELAKFTYQNNNRRKTLKSEAVEKARTYITENSLENAPAFVINLPGTEEGIVGIVAGDLSDEDTGYGVPAIIVTESKENPNYLKGSARSIDGINIKECLDQLADLLVVYGGHAGAGGLTIKKSDFETFAKKFTQIVSNYPNSSTKKETKYFEIKPTEFKDAIALLKEYAPFGEGNKKPVFKTTTNPIPVKTQDGESSVLLLGKDKETVKIILGEDTAAIGFKFGKEFANTESDQKANIDEITLYGNLSENVFRDTVTYQILFKTYNAKYFAEQLTLF